MQTLTEHVLRMAPPGGLFDETVLSNLFPIRSAGARRALVHRASSHAEIDILKPGVYCLAPDLRRNHPHPFVVAALLHSPSHISLETALAHHGLIPEAVYQVTSATPLRSRTFENRLGSFTFTSVPTHRPKAGVVPEELAPGTWAFVATPLRALADLVYTRKKVEWRGDGFAFLHESLRIEPEDLAAISFEGFEEIHDSFRNRRTRAFLRGLKEALVA